VVYGAGLENRPDLVARLAADRELLGCPPDVLRRVRDPALLAASGLPYPQTVVGRAPAAPEGRWLRKPLRSGGGRGVRAWRGGAVGGAVVVQRRVEGLPCSAAAVADGRAAVLLGVSEQLLGRFGARGFTWCGNLVPPRLSEGERGSLCAAAERVCARIAEAFGVRGVFGVDMVWDGERAWVVEVNPRPPGSLEVIAPDAFAAHLEGRATPRRPRAGAAGKAVVFAREDIVMPDTGGWEARDVPHPGERIAAGRPICTLVATGATPDAVLTELETRAAGLPIGAHALA
jgi:predicted ATP-grasp superfamily ATP-dependent carboligase